MTGHDLLGREQFAGSLGAFVAQTEYVGKVWVQDDTPKPPAGGAIEQHGNGD